MAMMQFLKNLVLYISNFFFFVRFKRKKNDTAIVSLFEFMKCLSSKLISLFEGCKIMEWPANLILYINFIMEICMIRQLSLSVVILTLDYASM